MTATVTYESNLRTTCLHLQSGSAIETDAPMEQEYSNRRKARKREVMEERKEYDWD